MTTDYRTLCVELTDCLEKADWPNRYKQVFQFWVDIARAALADEPAPEDREPVSFTGRFTFPADGEVAELTGKLVEAANGAAAMGWDQHARRILRAAELLQRLSPPQPVPVSERLPGAEDCDAEGRCWLCYTNVCNVTQWTLVVRSAILDWPISHWLPATALPVPGQEVGE